MPSSPDAFDPTKARLDIALRVLKWSTISLCAVAVLMVLGAAAISWTAGDGQTFLTTVEKIFTALLPLVGTWVGTVLAFYFSRENYQAASDSVRETLNDVREKRLATHLAKDEMRTYEDTEKVVLEETDADGKALNLVSNFEAKLVGKVSRIPVFAHDGVARYLIHSGVLYEFFSTRLAGQNPPAKDSLTLGDLLADDKFGKIATKTFGFVSERDTLARAKEEMGSIAKRTGLSCQDVFVTSSGGPDEAVLGWLPDKRIERYAMLGD